MEKFHGRRHVGRPRLRWEDIRKDSSLLLNIRGWRRLAGGRNTWGRTTEGARACCGFSRHGRSRRGITYIVTCVGLYTYIYTTESRNCKRGVVYISKQVPMRKGTSNYNSLHLDELCNDSCEARWDVITFMRRNNDGEHSEKCIVRRFRRCAEVYLHKPR